MPTFAVHPVRRVSDWRGLRKALGLTQLQMASVVLTTREHYIAIETGREPNTRPQIEVLLRCWLQHPALVERLRVVGFKHPWPEDLVGTESPGTAA